MKNKIFVGLSGGVDSAVSAALLKEHGHDVTSVFIKIWSPEFLECTWREDRLDAMRVAAHLEIPFLEIDLSQEYLDSVVKDMLETYKKGLTPNPDVLCNKTIKFGAFARWAYANGAEMIATGHYARADSVNGEAVLLRAEDSDKDQTYFLYRLTGKDIERTVFPIGGMLKKDVRALAKKFGLPNAERPDSQGLCFVGDVSMHEFLGRFITLQEGSVVDEKEAVIGLHDGAALYTIGQRHGFRFHDGTPEGPYYVTAVDVEKNLVHVSKERANTNRDKASITELHWIGKAAVEMLAVTRYHSVPVKARIEGALSGYSIEFATPVLLTPGQSVVFYDGDVCLGGAVIQHTQPE